MASETIVAVFDTAAHAELAIADLKNAGIPTGAIEHFSQDTQRGELSTMERPRTHGGFWSWLTGENDGKGDGEQHAMYDRSLESGHTVVTVVADSSRADEVIALLDEHRPLDVDQHGGTYETAGMQTGTASMSSVEPVASPVATAPTASGPPAGMTSTLPSGEPGMTTTATSAPARQTATAGAAEQVIPLSEETLQVGKTTFDGGVTRVRRYTVERPVEEQIRLRDERVSVFRRPVSDASQSGGAADAFSEKIVEMTETNEQAVVGKTARVVEEVVVQKDAGERTETVRENVRHEEVDIEGPGTTKRP